MVAITRLIVDVFDVLRYRVLSVLLHVDCWQKIEELRPAWCRHMPVYVRWRLEAKRELGETDADLNRTVG